MGDGRGVDGCVGGWIERRKVGRGGRMVGGLLSKDWVSGIGSNATLKNIVHGTSVNISGSNCSNIRSGMYLRTMGGGKYIHGTILRLR